MPRRPEDVAKIKAVVQQLGTMAKELPPGYDSLRTNLTAAQGAARNALGSLLAELELDKPDGLR